MQRHQARGLHLGGRVGDPVLDRLLLGQLGPERLPLQRPLAEHVEGPLRLSEPAHAVVDAARAEADLGDLEALAAASDQVLPGHPAVVVQDL